MTRTISTSPPRGVLLALIIWKALELARAAAGEMGRPEAGLVPKPEPGLQNWNWHIQNTDVLQWHPGFPAAYSGPKSLQNSSEVKETISLDLYAGVRLWRGAEAHLDTMVWQGHGFSETAGAEAFPNGESFRLGN